MWSTAWPGVRAARRELAEHDLKMAHNRAVPFSETADSIVVTAPSGENGK